LRVLGRVRLSRASDESTSVERQREIIEAWVAANDHRIVGWATDLDVSGGVNPFATPELGDWLNNRAEKFDCVAAQKLDRLGRDSIRLNLLFGWALDTGHTIVSCTEGIDLSTPVGRLIANVIAFLAEGERLAIAERTKASQKKLRELGRWGGGKPVYGYKAEPRTDGPGYRLIPDKHASKVLNQIIDKALAGQSTESIATELNEAGELSPADYIRHRAGKPAKGSVWSNVGIRTLLRSKTLMGHATHKGATVRDDDGMPVWITDKPLIDQTKFDRIQAALDSRGFKVTNRSAKASPLLGVLLCGAIIHEPGCKQPCDCPPCGKPMHLRQNHNKARGKTYRYYQCLGGSNSGGGGAAKKHESNVVIADEVEEILQDEFLTQVGEENVKERVLIPASDHQTALDEALRGVDDLSRLLGTIQSETVKKRLLGQLEALDTRISELEKLESTPDRWDWVETPVTYRETWEGSNTEQRRQLLIRSGITYSMYRYPGTNAVTGHMVIPEDVKTRLAGERR